jgi:hypothetical protein
MQISVRYLMRIKNSFTKSQSYNRDANNEPSNIPVTIETRQKHSSHQHSPGKPTTCGKVSSAARPICLS